MNVSIWPKPADAGGALAARIYDRLKDGYEIWGVDRELDVDGVGAVVVRVSLRIRTDYSWMAADFPPIDYMAFVYELEYPLEADALLTLSYPRNNVRAAPQELTQLTDAAASGPLVEFLRVFLREEVVLEYVREEPRVAARDQDEGAMHPRARTCCLRATHRYGVPPVRLQRSGPVPPAPSNQVAGHTLPPADKLGRDRYARRSRLLERR